MSYAEIRSINGILPSKNSQSHSHSHSHSQSQSHSNSQSVNSHSQRFSSLSSSSDSISSSLVVMVPDVTSGPYPEQITDYPYTTNLMTYAYGGSPGVTTDRLTIVDGIRLNLTLNIYNVSGTIANPLVGADIFIWHCDAIGIYSSVDLSTASTNKQDTQGQYWARAYYPTDSNGSVTFYTIIPGWYNPRAVHIHLRVRLADPTTNTTFIVTTQLFTNQALTTAVNALSPYSENTTPGLTLSEDNIYSSISSDLASEMVLDTVGDLTNGYTATFNMGIDSTVIAAGEADASGSSSGSTTGSTSSSSSAPTSGLSIVVTMLIPALFSSLMMMIGYAY